MRLSAANVRDLVFGQQNIGNQSYFINRLGQCHTVRATDFPHFACLADGRRGQLAYEAYLEASWAYLQPHLNTPSRRQAKSAAHIVWGATAGGHRLPPVILTQRADGNLLVLDGNHRVSAALIHRKGLDAVVVPQRMTLLACATSASLEYRPSGWRSDVSVYFKGKEVVRGARRPMHSGAWRVPAELRASAHALVLGSWLGLEAQLLTETGVTVATSVEANAADAHRAVRLNAHMGSPIRFCDPSDVTGDWLDQHDAVILGCRGASVLSQLDCQPPTRLLSLFDGPDVDALLSRGYRQIALATWVRTS